MNTNFSNSQITKLLECFRGVSLDFLTKTDKKTTKHSFCDAILIILLNKLDKLGLDKSITLNIKKSLGKKTEFNLSICTVLERILIDVFVFDKQNSATIKFDFLGRIEKSNQAKEVIVIDILNVIKSTFPKLPLNFQNYDLQPITNNEKKVIELVRNKNYHSIKLIKKKGELELIESEEIIKTDRRIIDILKDINYQNIEIKQTLGKIVYINRTIKTKII